MNKIQATEQEIDAAEKEVKKLVSAQADLSTEAAKISTRVRDLENRRKRRPSALAEVFFSQPVPRDELEELYHIDTELLELTPLNADFASAGEILGKRQYEIQQQLIELRQKLTHLREVFPKYADQKEVFKRWTELEHQPRSTGYDATKNARAAKERLLQLAAELGMSEDCEKFIAEVEKSVSS